MSRGPSIPTSESSDKINLSSLTLQQLRCVAAVDRHRNFSDAARSCHVSQPALSAQVKKVEDVLGFLLFDRTRQPIMTTEHGTLVVAQARVVLEQVERIGAIASSATSSQELEGRYAIGLIPSVLPTLLPRFLPQMVADHPRLELEIHQLKTEELVRRLRQGSLDAGIAATPLDLPGIQERVLYHEPFQVYLPPDHPYAARDSLHQSDLVDDFVWLLQEGHCFRAQVLHLCSIDRSGCSGPRIAYDGDSFDTLVQLVDAGVGITLLPELLIRALPPARRRAQARRFPAPEPVRELSLLLGREHASRAITDALVAMIQDAVPDDLRGPAARGRVVPPITAR